MYNKDISLDEIKKLRKKAVDAVIFGGMTRTKAAEIFGFSKATMTKYIREYKKYGNHNYEYKKCGIKSGKKLRAKMTQPQIDQLVSDILSHTPDELGMKHTLWNTKVIEEYIELTYSINYEKNCFKGTLYRLGFKPKKPIKLALAQTSEEFKIWLESVYPKIRNKTKTHSSHARIYWINQILIQSADKQDELHINNNNTSMFIKANLGTDFKCNILTALTPQGALNWVALIDKLTDTGFIKFLDRLMKHAGQPIFLIVPNHKIYNNKKVENHAAKYSSQSFCLCKLKFLLQ